MLSRRVRWLILSTILVEGIRALIKLLFAGVSD